ncbi:Sec-independent protein translocase protein TatA (modular protein) [Desulfamplus magnetovallimortis]|uniref:Sec-independent protein translocase protein TatA n=1 Tax=Desulfamplus magnetovallimortis TaxID=1246637 RepID=A0A1W1HBH8_9BACT|nr:twin-arginine translocase TatA/TatE family subunit [Desulfamplus magnetovallimortis]SLM29745.1 Sec-independent protein translocase protein TatA (modular protein) [Desulfamplus magnetovallimortis]
MFGLGMPEILLILAIALMVIGPKKLPELAKTLGRALGEFKNAAQDFKRSIDLESSTREFTEPVKNIKTDIKNSINPLADQKENKNSVDTGGTPDNIKSSDKKKTKIDDPYGKNENMEYSHIGNDSLAEADYKKKSDKVEK